MTEPTTPVVQENSPAEEPRGAVVELIEVRDDERLPYTGTGSIVRPNLLRVNGVPLWATVDNPVVVEEIEVDGETSHPFKVTLRLHARALSIGGTPAFDPDVEGGADPRRGAVIEIPDLDALEPGTDLERPYVLLNGNRLYTDGGVGVGPVATEGAEGRVAVVTLTLLCRKFLVDDELRAPAEG